MVFITILFMLPTASPISRTNFNYTVVAVLVVIGFAGIYWLVSAQNWFTGPRVQGTAEELAAIEQELAGATGRQRRRDAVRASQPHRGRRAGQDHRAGRTGSNRTG